MRLVVEHVIYTKNNAKKVPFKYKCKLLILILIGLLYSYIIYYYRFLKLDSAPIYSKVYKPISF